MTSARSLTLAGTIVGLIGSGLGIFLSLFWMVATGFSGFDTGVAPSLMLVSCLVGAIAALAGLRWPFAAALTMVVAAVGVAVPVMIVAGWHMISIIPAGILLLASVLTGLGFTINEPRRWASERLALPVPLAFAGILVATLLPMINQLQQNVELARNSHSVSKFTADGTFVERWGTYGSEGGQFTCPTGIAVDTQGSIYIVDNLNRVQIFDPSGAFVSKFSISGRPGSRGIAVDDEGNIYATTKDHPVQVFRSSGTPLASWGSFGEGYAQILSPRGIAVDSSGKVYVADYSNRRVAVFSPDGHLLPKKLAPPPAEREGSEPWRPIGVAVDQAGRIYVTAPVETYRARHRPSVWVFSPSGTLLNSWGSRGSGDGQLSSPRGIAVDSSSGKVYVADSGNHRVQVFSADGNFLRKWGSEENYGDGMLGKPQWIAVDASGTVYGDTTRPTQYRGVRPSLPREPATNCPR